VDVLGDEYTAGVSSGFRQMYDWEKTLSAVQEFFVAYRLINAEEFYFTSHTIDPYTLFSVTSKILNPEVEFHLKTL